MRALHCLSRRYTSFGASATRKNAKDTLERRRVPYNYRFEALQPQESQALGARCCTPQPQPSGLSQDGLLRLKEPFIWFYSGPNMELSGLAAHPGPTPNPQHSALKASHLTLACCDALRPLSRAAKRVQSQMLPGRVRTGIAAFGSTGLLLPEGSIRTHVLRLKLYCIGLLGHF